jgi:hypothetical protein
MANLFGVTLVTATVARISRDFARCLQGSAEVVRDHIVAAPINHMDASGFRIGGMTQWLHVAGTALLTFYRSTRSAAASWPTLPAWSSTTTASRVWGDDRFLICPQVGEYGISDFLPHCR